MVDVKAIVGEWERVEKEKRERLFAMVEETEGMTLEKLYEEESLRRMGITREEMMRLASKVLLLDKVGIGNEWRTENNDRVSEADEGREATLGGGEGEQGDQDRMKRLLTNTPLRFIHTK